MESYRPMTRDDGSGIRQQCGNCIHWLEMANNKAEGACREQSPKVVDLANAVQPNTAVTAWCGCWGDRGDNLA